MYATVLWAPYAVTVFVRRRRIALTARAIVAAAPEKHARAGVAWHLAHPIARGITIVVPMVVAANVAFASASGLNASAI